MFGFKGGAEELGWDGGVDRRQPVARQAGRRHRDDGDPGRGRHRQLDARPRRRRRRVRPGEGRRHSGRRRELRGHGHRRDGVVGAQPAAAPARRSPSSRSTSPTRSRAPRCWRSAARPSRRSRPTSSASPRTRRADGLDDRRRGAQHEGHGRDRAADRRRPVDQAPGRRRHLGLQRRLRARARPPRSPPAGEKVYDGSERRRDRVRPERRRRRDRGDQGASPHGDGRSGPRRHRLGADQGALRVRRGGQGRRPAQASSSSRARTWTLENIDDYTPPRERHYTLDTVPLVDARGLIAAA